MPLARDGLLLEPINVGVVLVVLALGLLDSAVVRLAAVSDAALSSALGATVLVQGVREAGFGQFLLLLVFLLPTEESANRAGRTRWAPLRSGHWVGIRSQVEDREFQRCLHRREVRRCGWLIQGVAQHRGERAYPGLGRLRALRS